METCIKELSPYELQKQKNREKQRKWAMQHPDKVKENARRKIERIRNDPERKAHFAIIRRDYYERNNSRIKERSRQYKKEYRIKHPDKVKEQNRRKYERIKNDPERHRRDLERKRQYNKRNKDRINEQRRLRQHSSEQARARYNLQHNHYYHNKIKPQRIVSKEESYKGSLVYFISDGEYVKIGVSANVQCRLASLQNASPRRLKLLGTAAGGYPLEKKLHKMFASLRVNGEWFRSSHKLLEHIKGVCLHKVTPKRTRAKSNQLNGQLGINWGDAT